MFKSIATAHSECAAKQENKTSYDTDYIVPDLIDFFGDDIHKKEIFITVKNILLTKKWFVVRNF